MTPAWRRGRPFDWARPAAAAQLHAAVARRRDDRHPSPSGCPRPAAAGDGAAICTSTPDRRRP